MTTLRWTDRDGRSKRLNVPPARAESVSARLADQGMTDIVVEQSDVEKLTSRLDSLIERLDGVRQGTGAAIDLSDLRGGKA